MASGRPDYHLARTNVYLTNHFIKWMNPGMVADLISPRARVKNANDKYAVWDRENMRHYNTLRAHLTESARFQKGWSSDTYSTEPYAMHELVGPMDRKNADTPVRPEFDLVEDLSAVLDLDREKRIHTLVSASGSVLAANKQTLAAGERWDDESDSSKPLLHIRKAKSAIFTATRMRANAFIIPYEDSLVLSQNKQIIDLLKGTHPELVTDGGLPPKIQGLWVIEPGAGVNTAKRGQSDSISSVWPSGVAYVAYIDGLPAVSDLSEQGGVGRFVQLEKPKSSANKITWVRSFEWMGRIVRQWVKPEIQNADVYEIEEQGIDEKLISNACGASISNTLSTAA